MLILIFDPPVHLSLANDTKASFVDVIDWCCDTVIRNAKWDYSDKHFADFIKQQSVKLKHHIVFKTTYHWSLR